MYVVTADSYVGTGDCHSPLVIRNASDFRISVNGAELMPGDSVRFFSWSTFDTFIVTTSYADHVGARS